MTPVEIRPLAKTDPPIIEAEQRISARSPIAGIGFGLHPGYNAAQRMYSERGYVPDGNGLWDAEEFPHEGQRVILDDSLALFLTRRLRSA